MAHYERGFATVEYDEHCDAVVGRLKEFTEDEEFKEYMESIIDAVEQTETDKILSDTSQFEGALTQEDQAWSVKDWAPRAENAGVDHMAMVMPEAVVAKMSVDNIVEMSEDDIERELFDDIDDARDWLNDR